MKGGTAEELPTSSLRGFWKAELRLRGPKYAAPQVFFNSSPVQNGTITPDSGAASYEPVNLNGSQRGGRPMVAFFPERLKNVRIVEGEAWKPVVTDDFILVPNPGKAGAEKTMKVVFTA